MFRDQELVNSAKYGISIYDEDRNTKLLSLRIGNVVEEDFGKYKCYATNIRGSDEVSFLLYGITDTARGRSVATANRMVPFVTLLLLTGSMYV
ncbi:hypothetical protein MAR_024526 [Mya arenaria]|uniref:Immunoglobulin I-set domain-containing protein n=1 Tax=Mya arenaria TaxID=6604 RepID=A0ABY7DVP4_MYAAR|nr:hypothetical protein MAR_024526 [Mya arenaria]